MLINTNSEEFQNLCVIRQSRKKYDRAFEYEQAKKAHLMFTKLIALCGKDLIKQIDEANKEQGE
jgi:hypothetical protein